MTLSPTRRVHDPGLSLIPRTPMAWRPYTNLIDGELDNRAPRKVTGWIRFLRRGGEPLKALFDLEGDFHEDIRGKVIRLSNPNPSDENASLGLEGTYMKGFSEMQRGSVGDMTAGHALGPWTEELAQKLMAQNELIWEENGLPNEERAQRRRKWAARYRTHIEAEEPYYPYVNYPYIEWYSNVNGRVVLELDDSQVEILDEKAFPSGEKSPKELLEDVKRRDRAMADFMTGMMQKVSDENRKKGGDGKVFGAVIQ